jgi:rubrerythrin
MTTNNQINGTIDNLIQINFERMSTFDKASQSTTDEELKNYFENRADESERHIEELEAVRSFSGGPVKVLQNMFLLPACKLFDNAIYRKKVNAIIESAYRVEKHMLDWYQKMVDEVPGEIGKLLTEQLMTVKKSQLELSQLTSAMK